MAKYRKKPIVIEAVQWKGEIDDEIYDFVRSSDFHLDGEIIFDEPQMKIVTLEGEMVAEPGDWIIKGIKGEFYPCKPDIFEQTNELVE